jgi:D-serine deaminase-like pyridoxal phosphate-dependent protein
MVEELASVARRSPNAPLIGQPGSRRKLLTPSLVLDLDLFEQNLATMKEFVSGRPEKLRPHAKTHKSAEIAKRQIAGGAVGICCAKLGEAQVLAALGVDGILITSPVVGDAKVEALLDLNDQLSELMVVVDNQSNVDMLQKAAAWRQKKLMVLIDLGMGRNRTGVPTPDAAGQFVSLIADRPNLQLRGLQAYAGHLQHIADATEREEGARKEQARIRAAVNAMTAAGFGRDIVTGSGTGTFDFDVDVDLFTELEVGSYIFMDTDYNTVRRKPGLSRPFTTSLFVQATVVSASVAGRATTDAGFKSLATDGPKPAILQGAPNGSSFVFMGDEHGCVILPEGANGLNVGDAILYETPHCDPTVNLYDFYHCVRGDVLESIWPVDSRGATW